MRRILLLLVLATLGAFTGCSPSKVFTARGNTEAAARIVAVPTAEEAISHLNQNARSIQSIEADRLSIRVHQGEGLTRQSFTVSGNLQYMKPKQFRLLADALGTTQADIGSNEQEFWFWFKRNDPPALYHCSYQDFAHAREIRLPVHPDWIAEAMCAQELPREHAYAAKRSGNLLELTTNTTTPQGEMFQKTIQVALSGPNQGRIVGFRLRNAQGQDVWVADIHEYQDLRDTGGHVVPRKMTLRSPLEKLDLDLKIDGCQVNSLKAANQEFFKRPNMPQEINLAHAVQLAHPQARTR